MTEPCAQEKRVYALEATLEAISGNLSELKDTARETYRILADISKQGAEISAIMSRLERVELGLEKMDSRLRSLDEILVSHSAFVAQYNQAEAKATSIRNPIISGLTVTTVFAVVSFLLWVAKTLHYTGKGG